MPPQMNNTTISRHRQRKTTRILVVFLLLWLLIAVVAVFFQRDMLDWLSLRGYTAPATVATLAKDDTMTSQATKVFYVNHPDIESKQVFTGNCQNHTEQTIVLGCYHGNQNGIYILKVSDSRLDGVMQVTAAHEMLHAAYDRLSDKDRQKVDDWLLNYYKNGLTDERVRATIEAYKKSEPNDVVNEMHSVFGTEVANLPAPLETYYKKYFTDRTKVVAYAADYSAEFTSRQQKVAAYDAQLQNLKATIDVNNDYLQKQQATLESERRQLESDRNSSDPGNYNARVDSYNNQVADYNAKISATKQLIAQYNTIVEQRNAIALEEQSLAQALSGDSVPATAQ